MTARLFFLFNFFFQKLPKTIIATQIRSTVKYIPKRNKKKVYAYFPCIMTNHSKTQKITQQYIYKPNKISSIAWEKKITSPLLIDKSTFIIGKY
jgi:hypothetical protein